MGELRCMKRSSDWPARGDGREGVTPLAAGGFVVLPGFTGAASGVSGSSGGAYVIVISSETGPVWPVMVTMCATSVCVPRRNIINSENLPLLVQDVEPSSSLPLYTATITDGVTTGQAPDNSMAPVSLITELLSGAVIMAGSDGIGAGTVAVTTRSSAVAVRSIINRVAPEMSTSSTSAQYEVCRW